MKGCYIVWVGLETKDVPRWLSPRVLQPHGLFQVSVSKSAFPFLSFLFFSSFLPLSLSLLPSLPSSPFPFSFLWFWCFETGPHCPELTILLRQPWECITVDCHISCISFLSYSPLSSTKPRERSADTMGAWKVRGGSHGLSQHIQLGA